MKSSQMDWPAAWRACSGVLGADIIGWIGGSGSVPQFTTGASLAWPAP